MTIINTIINYHILRITLRLPPPFLSDTEIEIIKQPLYIVIDNRIQIKPNLWYRNRYSVWADVYYKHQSRTLAIHII